MMDNKKFNQSVIHGKRLRMRWIICGISLLISWAAAAPNLVAASRLPNVIVMVADDLGYRELGCFGQQKIRTPHLDVLAKDGMKLTQHYSGNAVCAPSRCVLMTAKHPGHAWIRNNSEMKPEGQLPIPQGEVTLAEQLREAGYATGMFGKWGLGGPGSEGTPNRQGFDQFYGYNCQRHAHSYYPAYLWHNTQQVPLANDPPVPGHAGLAEGADPTDPQSYLRFQGTDYAPDRIHRQVLKFIRANQKHPFFLYYPTVIPHVALHVPNDELKPYLELGWNDPPFTREKGVGYTPHFTPRAAYAAMISRMDRYLGNILQLVDDLGLSEDTIVIFTSDNGTTHLDQEVDYEFFRSVGELRGLKGSLYEGGIRVPTIVRWTGRIAPGSISDRVSGFEDWMPTILELIGKSNMNPSGIDGISLAPSLLGRSQEPRPFLYREFSGYGGQQAIRVGDWKAIRTDLAKGKVETQLYNLAEDVSETTDVSAQFPDIAAELSVMMTKQHSTSEQFPLRPFD